MLIAQIFSRIRNYYELSKTLNLTNEEEKKITIEIVYHLKRLLKIILSKEEKNEYKNRLKLIKKPHELKDIQTYIKQKNKKRYWYRLLSIKSNLLLNFTNNEPKILNAIYKDFEKKLYKPSNSAKDHFYYLEGEPSKTQTDINQYFKNIIKEIQTKKLTNIIIPSYCILDFSNNKNESEFEYIASLISGCIIIDITDKNHYKRALDYILQIAQSNSNIKFGLSLQSNIKKTIFYLSEILNQLTKQQQASFILRINKNNFYSSRNKEAIFQQIKTNTYYKWSIYTICNLIRKYNIKCIVNSNNLYDIAWIQLLKNQLNIENKIIFETNRTKFPNIAKLTQILNKNSLHSEIILTPKEISTKINIVIKKLLIQHKLYTEFNKNNRTEEEVFKKTHRQFFNYLEHNYLDKYLNFHKNQTTNL